MKTCEVCGALAPAEAETCACCGEASWLASPFAVPIQTAEADADTKPAAPSLDAGQSNRRRPK